MWHRPALGIIQSCLLVSGCSWSLHAMLSSWRLHHAHPFFPNLAAVFYLFPSCQFSGMCGCTLFTQVDGNRASESTGITWKRVSDPSPDAHFYVKSHWLPEDEIHRSLLFLPPHNSFRPTPIWVCQTPFSKIRTHSIGKEGKCAYGISEAFSILVTCNRS